MELRSRHWLLAFALAAAIHLALAFLFYESDEGAQAVGLGGIEVSLGPAGGSPGAAGSAVEPEVPEAETAEAPETSTVETEVETLDPETPEIVEQMSEPVETLTDPIEEVETARPEDVTPPEPEPVIPPLAQAQTELDEVQAREVKPTPPKPKPKPKPKPRPKPKPSAPQPKPSAPQPKPPASAQPERQAKVTRSAPAAPSGTGGKAGTQQEKAAGSGDATPGGGMPGATADYFAHLRAWLERHKRYPRRAQLRRQEGTVMLRFVMDPEGRVLSYRIERSSGHRLLDEEVREMIERASPLPAMPEDMQQAQLELVVPVSFFLR